MPLIYSFVARGSTVLADFTSYTGNFSTVALQVRITRQNTRGCTRASPLSVWPGAATVCKPQEGSVPGARPPGLGTQAVSARRRLRCHPPARLLPAPPPAGLLSVAGTGEGGTGRQCQVYLLMRWTQ